VVPPFYWARVTDNADPDGLNRVRVSKHGEEDIVAEWIPVLTPYGSCDAGLSFIPEIDDQVLVVCLDAVDVCKAVIGSIWFNGALPPETGENAAADLNGDGENSLRFIKSRAGHQFIFDDTEGTEKIQLITSDKKSRLEFCLEEELTSLVTENDLIIGSGSVASIQADEVEIISEKEFSICTEEFQVDSKKDIDINASNNMTVDGSGVSLN